MVQRVTYRRRKSYNTKSNRVRKVLTPGGNLTIQYTKKKASVPKCADTGKALSGIPALRPFQYKSLCKRKRSVSRAYGGMLCASAVRQRIVRAFLLEEQKIVKQVTREKIAAAAAAKKAAATTKKAKK
eukprot:TRINITY_DN53952_c0_g1_i1.p3 TRINITY_DN53952_c0_g1~~TRINITY_DN53952_c0_g1_i1.p3  ORF type:complete len:128 (+),score=23.40 TRINITY_DN53952_c0_g1_i1:21-404(+)